MELQNYKILTIKNGDILKYIAKEYFEWDGTKTEPMRELLQQLGTNLCRKNNPNIFVNCLIEIVKGLQTEYDFVLIPDIRFKNEIERWNEDTDFFTYTIRLNRKDKDGNDYNNHLTDEQKQHISETALDNYGFNYYIENKNINDLDYAAEVILKDILEIEKRGLTYGEKEK